MAAQKHHEAELIAIYRLEFYKKQKNWKLSADTKKEKEQQNSIPIASGKTSNILNETYSIECNTNANASVLNDAFLKDDSDKDAPVSSARTSLCTQWLEPINACEQCCQHSDQKPQNPWADYIDDDWPGSADPVDKCSGDGNEFDGFNGWAEGMVWTNSGLPQVGWIGDVAAPMNIQGANSPNQIAWPAGTMLYQELDHFDQINARPDDQIWVPHIWGEDEIFAETLESIDEFMIGAHSAPHSSEVELCVPECDDEEIKVDEGSLSRMSGAALAAAVRRHSGSLRRLLREAGQRRKYKSTLSLDVCAPDHVALAPRGFFSTDYSYEAFPTKDIPVTPLSLVYPLSDVFTPPPTTNQCKDGFVPLPPTNQCKDSFARSPSTNQFKDGFAPLPPTNQCKDGFVPLPPTNQCKDSFARSPSTNQFKDGFAPLPPTNQCKDGFAPLPPTNQCKDGFAPMPPTNQCKDDFVPFQPTNQCKDGFIPLPPRNQCKYEIVPSPLTPLVSTIQYKDDVTPVPLPNHCKNEFTPPPTTNPCTGGFTQLQPSSQSKDAFTPLSPANLYRDGFLAGSYRNKVPLAFVGRGRGRLREDIGVKA